MSEGLREGGRKAGGQRGHLDRPILTRRLRHLAVPGRDGAAGAHGRREGRERGGRGGAGAMLGVSRPPQEGPWRSRCRPEPVLPVLRAGQGVMGINWKWGKF